MTLSIPVWMFWGIGAGICFGTAGFILKKGTTKSGYFGTMVDPISMLGVGVFGTLGAVAFIKGILVLLN